VLACVEVLRYNRSLFPAASTCDEDHPHRAGGVSPPVAFRCFLTRATLFERQLVSALPWWYTHVVQSSLLNLNRIPYDEAERDRRLNVTILNVEWLLWAGIGVALVAMALVGVAFYHPQWAPWAWAVDLALAGILLMDLAVWIIVVAKSWRGAVPRKNESESDAHSVLIFPDL
jgi:hypothetical protein